MDCSQILNLATSFLDDELPLDICAIVDAHLQGCPECRRHFEMERAAKRLISHRLPCYHVSPEFKQRLYSYLQTGLNKT